MMLSFVVFLLSRLQEPEKSRWQRSAVKLPFQQDDACPQTHLTMSLLSLKMETAGMKSPSLNLL